MKRELGNATTWLREHKLTLNLKKTQIMYFGTTHKLNWVDTDKLEVDDGNVDIVKRFKYLGIMLDPKLSFAEHVNYLIKKITPKAKTLNRIRCHIGTKTALYLYNSLIAPLFTYNDFIYDAMGITEANKLQVIQNTCIRNCLKKPRLTPRIELYTEGRILPLYMQRQINTSSVVHKGLNQSSTEHINGMFNLVGGVGDRVLRSEIQGDVETPRYRLEICKGNIAYRGPKYYNILPPEARDIESNRAFNKKLYRLAKSSLEIPV